MRLVLMESKKKSKSEPATHRTAATEGESAIRLLESNGYIVKRRANGQAELACPFHEEPGELARNKKANFYVDVESSKFQCHSASCGQRGNLVILERFFGVDVSSDPHFRTREVRLQEYESCLTHDMMEPFFEHGLIESTIRRFRYGWSNEHQAYVIPYLQGRRPVAFRFYNPNPAEGKLKYWWEEGSRAQLYNVDDSVGDDKQQVFIAEGELKAALICQMGYAAVGVPGAGTFKDEWFSEFQKIRTVYICFDNDNPDFHVHTPCHKCEGVCKGHNPGQEAATSLVQKFDWRGKNILLPLPDGERKTDINEYFVRDGYTASDFSQLAFGISKTPFIVKSLSEIELEPPEESDFLVEQGILSKGGRLLLTGAPKAGKSIMAQNLALSLGAGIPFLRRFEVAKPTRVLLLDRELSRRALWDRFNILIGDRPGYRAAMDNVLIDHDHLIRLDHPGAVDVLTQLVEQNGAEVVMFDTAYKFFSGDMEKSSSVSKAFETLDMVIHNTGCSVVLTHHHRKGQMRSSGGGYEESAHPDQVAGSFLWTGWPNGTILLNFLNRRVEDPFNTIAHFTAFRDAAAPEPLALYRDRDSIAYTAIKEYKHEDSTPQPPKPATKPSAEIIADLLLRMVPIVEEDFLHAAATKLGVRYDTIKPYYIDVMSGNEFERKGRPPVIRFKGEVEEETWEDEHAGQLQLVNDLGSA